MNRLKKILIIITILICIVSLIIVGYIFIKDYLECNSNNEDIDDLIDEVFVEDFNEKEIKDIAPTQTANCGCSTSSAAVLISEDGKNYLKIRKLTPLECWRLMGFDDMDFYKAKDTGISDTQLYRQAGNSIVVNVLQVIFKNLIKVINL